MERSVVRVDPSIPPAFAQVSSALRAGRFAPLTLAIAVASARPHYAPHHGDSVMANVERTATRIAGFASAEMDFQLMRSLGAANCGGGTPGEVFAARRAIAGDDPYGWPPAFAELAERVSVSAAE